MKKKDQETAKRLAEALRQNLLRRKAQKKQKESKQNGDKTNNI